MPTTINGIGTQYYGKKNPRVYEGFCEACKRNAKLTDYETGHYFVVLYIPVVPLGKKQILGDCSICRRHRVMPLKQWEQLRDESLESGLNELAADMHDPAKAIDLLQRMTVFNQMDEATELAAATSKQHADDFDTQVALGSWYEQQGYGELADKCFHRAIEIDPQHPTTKRIQAVDAIHRGEPAKAAGHLKTLRDSPQHYDPALFYLLAGAYQTAGDHEQALQEFRGLLEHNPAFGNDKAFRKAVKASEKHLAVQTSILPKKRLFG
jgi:tetratricopeptide (TPR) repeat protein